MQEQYLVRKVKRPVNWNVEVPGSKSMTNRALLMAALTEGEVELNGVLFSEDSRYFLSSLQSLGFRVEIEENRKKVKLTGCNGIIPRKEAEIYVGSAGTAARFLTAMLGFSDGVYTIQASDQMKRRPMLPLFELLEELGAKITYLEQDGHLPIRICGRLQGKVLEEVTAVGQKDTLQIALDISKSTQFLSAMLLISPMVKQGMKIHITSEKKDGSYIRITRRMLEESGVKVLFDGSDYEVKADACYKRKIYRIEPDVSAACYFYAAAAITGGTTIVKNVCRNNSQGDMRFLEVLRQMGCEVTQKPEGIAVTGPADGKLKGIEIDMNDFSDQALTLAAIAPYADTAVRITNIGHIRGQESDRIYVIKTELTRLGIHCVEEESAVTVYPGQPQSECVDTYEDHRVAMAFSLVGLRADGIVINHPDCCGKTFEQYFEILDKLIDETNTVKNEEN